MAKNVLKHPERALEIGANVGSAFSTRSLKDALSSLPEVINFYRTCKWMYLGKYVWLISYKWNKNVKYYTHLHQ